MPFFEELTYRSDLSTDVHAWWLKRRGVSFGVSLILLPIYGAKSPSPDFGGVNRRFRY